MGESASFGRARNRSARGRAKALTEGSIPAYELTRLPLDQVAPTPLNPRRNFGSDEDKTRFGEELREVQLAACVAVTRSAYLKLWPEHETQIGPTAQHVLVNGERRFRSAVHVGLDKLDFVVRDDLAGSREDFVDHLLAENLDREDFDVIERARGVEQLVKVCAEDGGERGARSRAAERLSKDRSWVTNQLALLTLPAEIQVMLSAGEVSERDGRALARHFKEDSSRGAAELLAHLESTKQSAEQQKEEEQRLLAAGREALAQAGSGDLLSADNKSQEPGGTSTDSGAAPAESPTSVEGLLSADNKPSTPPTPASRADADRAVSPGETAAEPESESRREGTNESVPVPRRQQPDTDGSREQVVTGVKFPYDNAARAATFLDDRMDDAQFLKLVDILNGMAERRRSAASASTK
ncbi:ParB/RepB/Spo0J family partition protein [Streptomyces longhuiensis]|uniref:ParB/RepB/Spo0J family partition protein n=1 Tax=Streptomyces longhuiensis TaxID=2880933 RepID=UPI001D0A4CE4|nr:ParB/RepB/Spo0J family partition protein [Streptomyces longhuiensis]UDM05582.1 ParB/RepB/Spo0J family partition protein [Streptomyces longhuiensis]